ncbi:MAG: hypothetical protein JWQ88_1013 [Rhodoferax sp.]|nr:hypothetical protein [Rhodoferax sp.]
MVRRRAHRLTTTLIVVFALLFSQLALANYACPADRIAVASTTAMEMAPGVPCESMDMEMDKSQPVLCHQHCLNAPQSFDSVQLPALSLPPVVQVLFVAVALDAATADASVRHATDHPSRPPPDPLFLSTLRLRV